MVPKMAPTPLRARTIRVSRMKNVDYRRGAVPSLQRFDVEFEAS
jgi:hypothetical protein